ncbi:hypothetical protein KKP97_00125 [Methanothermococcus sp. SCGC AD-155-C09]|nr:hypothetical protein [Methanothermococcus sp. SCGC AD-155-C09]
MLFSNKNILILCLFLLLLNGVFAYDFGKIKVNHNDGSKTYDFNIDKVENYTYNLNFEHYGNIGSGMKVNIYINGNLVYTIDDSKDGSGRYKKKVSIDITNYLNNGSNTLKVEGVNLVADPSRDYYPYYALNKVHINEPFTLRVPVSLTQVIIYIITTVYIGMQYLKSIKS